MNKSIFITRFKQLCKLNKKTQAEIAETLGISINGLKHYMRKTNNSFPPVEYLDLMAKEFDVDIAYLIGEIDVPKHTALTVANTTGLSTRERDFQTDLKCDDEFDALMRERYPAYSGKKNKRTINEYADRTYAIDLITRNSKDFSIDFCFMIDFLANSNKITELAHLIYIFLFESSDNDTIIVKTRDWSTCCAYKTRIANKRVLINRIVSLFQEILEDKFDRRDSYGVDFDLDKTMACQLIEFIEKKYFSLPRSKMKKIVDRRIEEIQEINEASPILNYSSDKILGGYLIKLAQIYNYNLSSDFLKKYEKELSNPISYYTN